MSIENSSSGETAREIRAIGGIEITREQDAVRYQRRLLVPDEHTAELDTLEIGSEAPWASESALLSSLAKTWLGPGAWLYELTAEDAEDELVKIRLAGSLLEADISRRYEPAEIEFLPEWAGVRTAGPADCTGFEDEAQQKLPNGTRKYLNIGGHWAVPGDRIFRNAMALFRSRTGIAGANAATSGSVDLGYSPFEGEPPSGTGWIGRPAFTRLYIVSYNTRRPGNEITGYRGIGQNCPLRYAPSNFQARRWKAVGQKTETLRDSAGKSYTRIERSMLEAPFQLFWKVSDASELWVW